MTEEFVWRDLPRSIRKYHIIENTVFVPFDIQFIRRDQNQRRNSKACRTVIQNTMLVSFDIKFIRRDQKQSRNGACRQVIENTVLVYFDIKFIKRDQNQRRHGEACRASSTCFWSSLINLISKKTLTWFSIYHALLQV